LRRRTETGPTDDREIRYVDLPSRESGLPPGLIAVSSVADVRKTTNHASELLTQVIYGDSMEPLKEVGEWFLVRLDDGYIGWIRSWHVAAVGPQQQDGYRQDASHRVAVNHAEVLESPTEDALPVSDLVIGTVILVRECGRRGWRAVELPGGKKGFLRSRAVEKIPARKRISREKLSATGLRFLGVPYLWGGTTPKGFDCSGLMQRIYRLNGLLIPRDTDVQAKYGREKPVGTPGGLNTGDLIFFGGTKTKITHVAMILSEGLFLHASGQVRVGSLDPKSSLFDPKLVGEWCVSRDPLSE
jgi:cell wall-associated NlpC family hydrolase